MYINIYYFMYPMFTACACRRLIKLHTLLLYDTVFASRHVDTELIVLSKTVILKPLLAVFFYVYIQFLKLAPKLTNINLYINL